MAIALTEEVKDPIKKMQNAKPLTEGIPAISQEVIDELIEEINNMLSYAVHNGIIIKTEVNSLIQNSNIENLINTHNLLCENITPATPKSINFLKRLKRKNTDKMFINRLPSIRNLLILAFVFLAIFIGFEMLPDVNSATLNIGILAEESEPFTVLKILIYLGAISGIGVLFFLLKNTINSLKNGTLIPEDSVEYTIQIMLGIIAGLTMTEIVPLNFYDINDAVNFEKPILALLGGFSSDTIFSILKALIDKLKNIFTGVKN